MREVVRRIAADLERGVPLYEVGIVYRQNDPYAALVRDALDAAGLPWVSSEGEHLDETRPGRCLLSLLRLPGDDFSREALLAWLETAPGPVAPAATLSAAAWNRLARAANVVRGVGQWRDRLAAYVARLEAVRAGEGEDEGSARSAARGRQAEAARRAAALIGNLVRDLQPPAPGVSWSAFVDWVAGLRDRYVGRPEDWPEAERPVARALDDAIQRLRLLDDLDPQPTPATFLGALADALAGGRVRHGRFGEGILVEPLVAVTGLAFTRLYVLGLGEGRFPPPPPVDPFFGASSPSGDGDPLRRRERWLAEERRDFLVCLSAADGGAMTLSAPDADGQRATSPSRWLLEAAEKLVGRPLDAASFADLDEAAHPWLRVVRSAHDGVRRADPPADLEDRRLAEAAHWLAAGRALTAHPLAARSDLPLGRALALGGARGSLELTEFDGNLSRRARGSRRLLGIFADRRPISTSALETWAACGFRYFLDRVVGIEPGGLSAEESPEIEARERGDVIHAVLDDFFRRLKRDGRPRPGERYTAADARLLADVAVEHFANLAARGAAGHPLAWENVQRAILADLQAFLAADAAWRRDHGLTPVAFEQRFGFSSEDSWDAATVSVPDENGGLRLRFRGLIDRIDRDEAGRAVVLDYKTGASEGYRGLGEDPVLAGQHLQLALYRRVVQEHLPGVTAVGGAFWFVTSRGGLRLVSIGDDGALVDRRLEEVLAIVARGIRAGAFPAVPGPARWPSGFAGCSSCDFDRVCAARRDVLWRRKQADPLAAIHRALSVTGDTGDGE